MGGKKSLVGTSPIGCGKGGMLIGLLKGILKLKKLADSYERRVKSRNNDTAGRGRGFYGASLAQVRRCCRVREKNNRDGTGK